MNEYTFWKRSEPLPKAGEAHDVFTSREAASDALSAHIATNLDLGPDRSAYAILTREVGDWHE